MKLGVKLGILLCGLSLFIWPLKLQAYYTGMPADVVIGQPDFTSTNGYFTDACPIVDEYSVCGPEGILIVGGKLIVADRGNRRVLIYNSVPTSNHAAADVVLGKPDFTTGRDIGTPTLSFFNSAWDVASDGTRLFITDAYDCHVLVYNTIPTVSGAAADYIIGQPDVTSCDPDPEPDYSPTQLTMKAPWGVYYDAVSGKLLVSDGEYARVTIYNSVPTNNFTPPDLEIGQVDFVSATASGVNAQNFLAMGPAKVFEGKVFVTDGYGGRVLIWNSLPIVNYQAADVVLGKESFTSTAYPGVASNTIDGQASGLDYDGTHLFVGDPDHNRVMIFDGIPTANFTGAAMFLGQTSSTGDEACHRPTDEYSLCMPAVGIVHTGNYLFVSDTGHNRILRFSDVSQPAAAESNVSSSTTAQSGPACPENFVYCAETGPAVESLSAGVTVISGTGGAVGSGAMIASDASVHNVHVVIGPTDTNYLTQTNIPVPQQQNLNVAGIIYNYESLSAFNGYPISQFDKPVTIIIPYDPAKLNGVSPDKLRIGYYDPITNKWKRMMNNTVVNTQTHIVANTTKKFTYFTVVYPK